MNDVLQRIHLLALECFESWLIVFDSGTSILLGDEHLFGMLQACKQLYFLEHLEVYCWWCSGGSTPTVILSCWMRSVCLLNAWNQMTDQFNKFSDVSCSSCLDCS